MLHDIEELHRQASASCIKADFEAAVGLWRQLLELAPGDERAIEGIRLCEKLAAGDPPAPPPPDPAPEPTAAPVLSSGGVEDLDIAIDESLLDVGVALPTTAQARECTGADEVPESGPRTAVPLSAGADENGAAAGSAPGSIDLDAAQELQRRVDVLLRESREHVEQQNFDEAEQILVRVLILDEENQHALKLQQQIQESRQSAGVGPDAPPTYASTDAELALSDQEEEEEKEEETEAEEVEGLQILSLQTLPPVEPSAEAPAVDDSEPEPAPVADSDPGPAAPDSEKAGTGQAVATARASKAPKSKMALPAWASDRRVQLGAGGVLALVAVVLGLGFFGGEDAPVVEPIERSRAPKPVKAGGQEPQPAEEPAAPVVQKDPALLLQQARAGVASEDWAAAVIAYNELLRQVPDHPEALEKLPVAMEGYRQQQDQQRQWNEAVSAFESGNFREALRRFYHMQDSMDLARLKRYKLNGWYNLGLRALQGNRCSTALDHFDEALLIRAGDPGVIAAMALADACLDAGSPGTEIDSLEFRGLED